MYTALCSNNKLKARRTRVNSLAVTLEGETIHAIQNRGMLCLSSLPLPTAKMAEQHSQISLFDLPNLCTFLIAATAGPKTTMQFDDQPGLQLDLGGRHRIPPADRLYRERKHCCIKLCSCSPSVDDGSSTIVLFSRSGFYAGPSRHFSADTAGASRECHWSSSNGAWLICRRNRGGP